MPYDNIISRTDAAALIPEEVSTRLLQGMMNASAALTLFPRVPMSRAQQRMPVLSALPTAYFVGGDTGLKQTTEAAWTNKFLNVEELACIVPIPENVIDDTDFDVWEMVRPLLEQAMARALDAAIFFSVNKPASWPDAVITAAIAAGNTQNTGAPATSGGYAGDISLLFAKVEEDGYDVSGIIANRIWRGRLRDVRDADGVRMLEVSPTEAYGVPITYPMRGLWPAVTSGNTTMIAGDFSEGILGVRQDFTYRLLDQAVITDNTGTIIYNLPQQDMVALRLTMRVAWQVANVINYDQQVEASRYPFAVLRVP